MIGIKPLYVKYHAFLVRYDLAIRGWEVSKHFTNTPNGCIEVNAGYISSVHHDRYLDCGTDRELLFRILRLPHEIHHEIGEILEEGIVKEIWIGKDNYVVGLDEVPEGLDLEKVEIVYERITS